MGLALSCLFVTVSDLWLPLIGSIKSLGAFLKTRSEDIRVRVRWRREAKDRRTTATVASLCSAVGGTNESSGVLTMGLTVTAPAVNLLLSEGEMKHSDHKNIIDGVCLSKRLSV